MEIFLDSFEGIVELLPVTLSISTYINLNSTSPDQVPDAIVTEDVVYAIDTIIILDDVETISASEVYDVESVIAGSAAIVYPTIAGIRGGGFAPTVIAVRTPPEGMHESIDPSIVPEVGIPVNTYTTTIESSNEQLDREILPILLDLSNLRYDITKTSKNRQVSWSQNILDRASDPQVSRSVINILTTNYREFPGGKKSRVR